MTLTLTRRTLLAATAATALPLPARLHAQDRRAALSDAARGLDQLHTLLLARDGETLVTESPRGPGPDRLANVKSVSKTLVATLAGIAIDRQDLPGTEATIGEVAPGLIPPGADPQVAAITVGDLVTLRAGLERTSGPNYGAWVSSGNWVADALSRPMVADPGGRMLYSTGTTHVLGALLAEATGSDLHRQARDRLARPLGIEIPPWTRDPQGRYLGGNEMAMTPRAMLRFGEMIRTGGTHDGTRIVSEDWIDASLRPRTRSPFSGLSYGYGWFLGGSGAGRFALARGYGGQVICLLPAQRATLVITSDPTRPARSGGYFGALMDLIDGPVQAALA